MDDTICPVTTEASNGDEVVVIGGVGVMCGGGGCDDGCDGCDGGRDRWCS